MDTRHVTSSRLLLFVCSFILVVAPGCAHQDPPSDVIARVGEAELTRADLSEMMAAVDLGSDSVEVQEQILEQWITNELMHQEALRRGLRNDPEVQRLLKENERTILINALVGQFYDQEVEEPSAADVQAYYERHREQLSLRTSYVNVRYLVADTRDDAETVQAALAGASSPEEADSLWTSLVQDYALDVEDALDLSGNFYPEHQLFSAQPPLRDHLRQLQDMQVGPIVAFDDQYHVLQLVQRVPAGTIPEPEWVEDEIRNRLIIQSRKQIVTRQVQRLRTEAQSRNELEVP